MTVIGIREIEFELYYNTKAMIDISAHCNGIENLAEWLGVDEPASRIERICIMLADLINGGIFKHNAEIELGVKQGEKKKFINSETIMSLVNPAQMAQYELSIYEALNAGMHFEKPDGLEEEDPDLAEVESEKN